MADVFSSHSSGLSSPATNGEAVTASNSTDLAQTSRAIYDRMLELYRKQPNLSQRSMES